MKELAVRLKHGADLKEEIEKLAREEKIDTAVICGGVGCLYQVCFRLAGAEASYTDCDDYEIVSLDGTISKGEAHIHIAVAAKDGLVKGGHLQKGCLINTTCELVIGILEEYTSKRVYDELTGYKEIVFEKR